MLSVMDFKKILIFFSLGSKLLREERGKNVMIKQDKIFITNELVSKNHLREGIKWGILTHIGSINKNEKQANKDI